MYMAVPKDIALLDRYGDPVQKQEATTPDFDPDFLKGFSQLMSQVSSITRAVSEQPYARHVWVYACANAITKELSRLKPVFFNEDAPEEIIRKHPALKIMARPNPMMTGSELFEAIILNLLLPTPCSPGGQCFILPTDENGNPVDLVRGQIPAFLYPYSDVSVKPHIEQGVFRGWDFIAPNDQKIFFFADQVIRLRLYNPYNWLLGLSPYSAAATSVISDAKTAALADRYMDNSANIGGILTTDSKLNKTQQENLKGMWHSQYEGFAKAGRTALLHSGLKFEHTARSLVDLQFKDQKEMNRQAILSAYGVSNTILGITETVNRSTAQVEKEIFWESTLQPLSDKLWLGLNQQWIEYLDGRNLQGKFDTSNVAALKKNQSMKVKDAKELIDQGVPANEAYRTVGLDVDTRGMEWLDKPIVKGQRTDLSTGEIFGNPNTLLAEEAKNNDDSSNDDEAKKDDTLDTYITDDKTEKEKFWNDYIEKTLKISEKEFKAKFIQFLIKQRNTFQDRVDSWSKSDSKTLQTKADDVSKFLPDIDKQDKALIAMADPIYDTGIDLQVKQMDKELGGLKKFKPSKKFAIGVRAERKKFLKGINKTTWKSMSNKISDAVASGAAQGLTNAQIAKNIKALESTAFGAKIKNAKHIARTETSAIATSTRNKIMIAEGVPKHQWITAGDELVRSPHAAENGNIVKIGNAFPVTGLQYPLDPNGPAGQVINCRCVTIAVK